MTKTNRLSIAATTPLEEDAITSQRQDVMTSKNKVTKARSHSSFYVSPKVLKTLRELALKRDCKVNDLICDGLRIVLAEHGRDFDRLNR